jgi:hypothetical protein
MDIPYAAPSQVNMAPPLGVELIKKINSSNNPKNVDRRKVVVYQGVYSKGDFSGSTRDFGESEVG